MTEAIQIFRWVWYSFLSKLKLYWMMMTFFPTPGEKISLNSGYQEVLVITDTVQYGAHVTEFVTKKLLLRLRGNLTVQDRNRHGVILQVIPFGQRDSVSILIPRHRIIKFLCERWFMDRTS